MRDKLKNLKFKKPFLYIVFFLVMFFAFLYSSFPKAGIKGLIISQIESNTPYQADLESASLAPPFSINIKDLILYRSKDKSQKIDSITLSPSIFSLFSSSTVVPFKANLEGGQVKGTLAVNKSGSGLDEIDAEVDNVKLDNIMAFLADSDETPALAGVLDGTIVIDFLPNAQGEFDFTVKGLELDNINVKGMKLPPLKNLDTVFSGNIEDRKTNVEVLNLKGDGIDLQISGTAPLIWEMSNGGVIDLGYRLEITGGDYAKFKGLLSPYLAQQRDGSLGGKIMGTLSNPKFEKGTVKRF